MKKKIIVSTVLSLTIFTFGKNVAAGTIDISSNMPRSGGITLDDKGKIIAATDQSLLKGAPKARAAVNFKDSRWVYFTEFWPDTAWANKRVYSNYNHYKKFHSSTAQIGKRSHKAYEVANKYSYAAITGKKSETSRVFYDY